MVYNNVVLLVFIFITVIQIEAFSALTDHDSHNRTSRNKSELDYRTVDVFRQLLNQETIIRMTLVQNVHVLMKDMLIMQEKLAKAENKISDIKTSTNNEIKELQKEVNFLRTENGLLKNYSVSFLNDLQELDKNLNNVSNTINDVKTEVRYLSIRLSVINTHSREMAEMLQQFNVSMEDTKQGIVDGQRNLSATLSELEARHRQAFGN